MINQEATLTFDYRDDYLRRPIAEKVIHLLTSHVRVSPLVIDGSWGTGKTEFCQKLISLVEANDAPPFRSVYVDAFRADHANQPLMMLLAAVLSLLPEPEKPELIKKALPALRFGLKTTGKAAIGWLLKQDIADLGEDFEKAMQTAGESIVDKSVEAMLGDHIKAEESIRALQDALAAVAKKRPIVLFVDELDRCRPDFAVAILEIIKHVFDVDGVQIVLVTNTQQLKATINHCYGSNVDAQRYLDKFLGFSFRLPEKFKPLNQYETILAAQAHFRAIATESPQLKDSAVVNYEIITFINDLIEIRSLSLREIETLARYLEIFQTLTNNEHLDQNTIYGYILLRIYAIYCHCFNPDLTKNLLSGKYSPATIADSLGKHSLFEAENHDHPTHSDTLLAILIINHKDLPPAFSYKNDEHKKYWNRTIISAFNANFGRPLAPDRAMKIVQDTIRIMEMGGW